MIKTVLNIDNYWKVIVYYDVDYDFFNVIYNTFRKYRVSNNVIREIYFIMSKYKAKAVTVSIHDYNISIVLFNKHKSYYDYINSIIHEAEHIKQSMLYFYQIDDSGEPPAYTIGYIASQMIKKFNLYQN